MTQTEIVGKLAALGAWVLAEHFDYDGMGVEIMGDEMQDELEKLGLLEKVEVSEPCNIGQEDTMDCSCAEYGDWPTDCFRMPLDVRVVMEEMSK